MNTFTLLGRVPSAKNHLQLIRVHGRTIPIKSKAYQTFKKSALLQFKDQFSGEPLTPTEITIAFTLKGRLDADLDNMCGTILDLLQDANIIENDKTVVDLHATKTGGAKDFSTIFSLI